MQRTVLVVVVLACVAVGIQGLLDPKAGGYKSFGTAIKNGHLYTTEETIFTHSSAKGGVVTEMWMTGGWDGFSRTRVRIYIDGEATASIDYRLYMAHGIGWDDDATWQGSDITGKNAHGGGIYHTFRIPFGKSIIITAQLDHQADNVFWFIVRGMDNMPIVMGDLILPSNTRLRLYKNENVTLQPYDYTNLSISAPTVGGALFMVTIAAESSDLNYLEACFRAYLDGNSEPQFLSSGTEDFFLSAFYYNGGQYATSQSGLTHFDTGNPTYLSMYKFFQRDPVIFQKGMRLVWRNMEDASCPSVWPPQKSNTDDKESVLRHLKEKRGSVGVAPMSYTSYVWVYEWQ